jgi:hypothetical protein
VTSVAGAQPTKRECVAFNEAGQELRVSGKLRDARERFHACAVQSCPQIIREDCVARLAEAERATPTITLVVKDARGNSVQPSRVAIDGHERTESDPRRAIELDPGEQTVQIAAEGYASVTKTLTVREGVKGRDEIILLSESSPASGLATSAAGDAASTQQLVAFGVGGAGIVSLIIGTYFGLAAKSTYDDASSPANCPRGPTSCNSSGIDGGKTADEQATISTVTFIAGGLLVAGGVALYVTASEKRTVSVAPSIGRTASGLSATMTW